MSSGRSVVVLILLLLSSACLSSQDDDQRPDYPRALVFFHRVQDALRRNDRTEISELIEYPLLIRLHGKKHLIKTRRELLDNFNQIFDSQVRCAVIQSTDKDVWGNSHGFMVGNGAIWFDDFSPPGTNEDLQAPSFWTKGKFLMMTVNNESDYCDTKGVVLGRD